VTPAPLDQPPAGQLANQQGFAVKDSSVAEYNGKAVTALLDGFPGSTHLSVPEHQQDGKLAEQRGQGYSAADLVEAVEFHCSMFPNLRPEVRLLSFKSCQPFAADCRVAAQSMHDVVGLVC
jgi:hypothetical protein